MRKQTLTLLCATSAILMILAGKQAAWAQGYAFSPPQGWTNVRPPGHGIAVWVHPGDQGFRQNISVIAERGRGSLDAYTLNGVNSLRATLTNVQFGHITHTTVCGSHPSTYLNYAATIHGRLLLYEQMATIWNGVAYVATYTRQSGEPSLPAAREALTSLCGGLAGGGAPALRSTTPTARVTATPGASAANYATPTPVGSVAPTITPRP